MEFIGNTWSGATFSECRRYRYTLWRRFSFECPLDRMCAFICLNPSVADETLDDPTIRRCIGFSRKWGFEGYVMLNLFAFRATDPKVMKAANMPVGPLSDAAIDFCVERCGRVVTAWGNHGTHQGRAIEVLGRIRNKGIYHLGLSRSHCPKHPLYLKADTLPILWPV